MSHPVQPDPIVRTALQLLPVPDHGDDFWDRLERSLDAESPAGHRAVGSRSLVALPSGPFASVGPTLRAPDPALALVPRALRRPSNVLLLVAAAAAVAVVALASTTLIEQREGTRLASPEELARSADLEASMDGLGSTGAALPELSAASEDASSEAVLAWMADVRAGDADGAWAAMGPASREHFGSRAAFEERLTAMAEDFAAWTRDPDEVLITPVQVDDDGTLAIVTLVGPALDGQEGGRSETVPVHLVDGEARLEPFTVAGPVEMVVPEGPAPSDEDIPVEAGEELVVVVPSGADAPVLRVDDGPAVVCGEADGTELTSLEDTPGQRCSYLPDEDLAPGTHTLTVAFVGADGASVSAESRQFEAA